MTSQQYSYPTTSTNIAAASSGWHNQEETAQPNNKNGANTTSASTPQSGEDHFSATFTDHSPMKDRAYPTLTPPSLFTDLERSTITVDAFSKIFMEDW